MTARCIDLSVVITTRHREAGCRRLVEALVRQFAADPDCAYEIVLVVDGHGAYPWTAAADVRTIVLEQRHGIARARNIGIGEARGALIGFLDDDCVPVGSWLAAVRRMSAQYPEHVAFGGPVIGTEPDNLFSRLREQVYYRETFGTGYVDPGAREDFTGPYVNGGNAVYRREALVAAGGFDEALPAYSDVELGRRMNLAAGAVLSPAMAIDHDHPSTLRAYLERCLRSGRARAILWRRGYRQDTPARVLAAICTHLLWTNPVDRRRHVGAWPARTIAVLTCQELAHGIGYAKELAGALGRGRNPGRLDGHAPRVGAGGGDGQPGTERGAA